MAPFDPHRSAGDAFKLQGHPGVVKGPADVGSAWLAFACRAAVVVAGASLAFLAGRVLRIRRGLVVAAMSEAGVPNASRVAQGMYRSLATSLIEFLLATIGVPLHCCARFEDSALVALSSRLGTRGMVIACAHTANWDLVACHVAQRSPLLVITKRLRVRWLDRLWQWTRRRWGVGLVAPGAASTLALHHLRRGGAVVAMSDQAPERRRGAAQGTFLGRAVGLDLAPALLAMRARAPLVIAFPQRLVDGAYAVHVEEVLFPPEFPTMDWALMAMGRAAQALEQFIARDPDQWLWLHRRWKPWPPHSRRTRPHCPQQLAHGARTPGKGASWSP